MSMTTEQGRELVDLATQYRKSGWDDARRRKFVKAAHALGYQGNTGGWIYRNGRIITQGWQSLAMMLTR